KIPVVEPGDGRGDEAKAATTIAAGRDAPRQNWLRREEYSFSRGDRQRNQQLWAEQERIAYAPVASRNHHIQQGWGRELRQRDRTTEEDPDLSFEPEIAEAGNHSLPQIYRAPTKSPTNGSCPVAAHNSNSAVLKEDRDDAAA
ncbi:unnamed protein product, partial [Ectocarpus fasciculatus]